MMHRWMGLLVAAALPCAAAAAFTPSFFAALVKKAPSAAPKFRRPTTTKGKQPTFKENIFENELGAQAPLGFFDPLGVVNNGDREKFDRLRSVEIKHGRVCMLAVVGYLVTEAGVRVPVFDGLPAGFEAITAIPGAGLYQVLFFIGILETNVMKDVAGTAEFDGDFRNGWLLDPGWDTFDEDTKLEKRAIELNQGRAAMMGILALMVHEKLGVSILPTALL